jgi:hypothetical protein
MILIEELLSFDFNDEYWTDLCQYDIETDFKNIKISKTKGVDFIGILNENSLILFEVKDLRRHRIENKHRTQKEGDDPIELEAAKKFRDTLAGIIGGARNSTHNSEMWQKYLAFLSNHKKQIQVVLWLEEDRPILPVSIAHRRNQAKGGTYTNVLKAKMKWLTPHVLVVDSENNPYSDGLNVMFLPNPLA